MARRARRAARAGTARRAHRAAWRGDSTGGRDPGGRVWSQRGRAPDAVATTARPGPAWPSRARRTPDRRVEAPLALTRPGSAPRPTRPVPAPGSPQRPTRGGLGTPADGGAAGLGPTVDPAGVGEGAHRNPGRPGWRWPAGAAAAGVGLAAGRGAVAGVASFRAAEAAGTGGVASFRAAEAAGAGGLDTAQPGPGVREAAESFLAPPDFTRLQMPGPGDDLAEIAGSLAPDALCRARRPCRGPASRRAAGLPEFMDPPTDPAGAGGPDGPAGTAGPGTGQRASGRAKQKRVGPALAVRHRRRRHRRHRGRGGDRARGLLWVAGRRLPRPGTSPASPGRGQGSRPGPGTPRGPAPGPGRPRAPAARRAARGRAAAPARATA